MLKTYHGSCHCQRVRFSAELDLASGTGKCNCSFCAKARFWGKMTGPEALQVQAGAEELSSYRFGSGRVEHLFCRHCGIRPFSRGDVEEIGGAFVSINLACLDDLDPAELAAAPVQYMDGRNDNWWNPPAETRHL